MPARPSEAHVAILPFSFFSWSHQVTGPVRLNIAVHLRFDRIIRRTHGPRAMPVRASYGPRTGMFFIPYGSRTASVRNLQGCRTAPESTQPEFAKIPHGRRIWPYGARMGFLRSPQGLFRGCLRTLNPYGARKLIVHALKLYGPRTERQNSYGAARGQGPCEWACDFCSEQPVNSRRTARTGCASVMWLGHCTWVLNSNQ